MTSLDIDFQHPQDAAMAVLEDVVCEFVQSGVEFLVVGGWVTKLLHSDRYPHPGTFDADLLINDASLRDGTFDSATEALLARGYIRAVKNQFQVHRVLRVRGEQLLFHADFLNRSGPDELDLITGNGRVQSIYTPAMELMFSHPPLRVLDPGVFPKLAAARFPSVDAFIAAKATAALVKKRTRDAFDIFVSIADAPEVVGARWRRLGDGAFVRALQNIHDAVAGDAVEKTLRHLPDGTPASVVIDVFSRFLGAASTRSGSRLE